MFDLIKQVYPKETTLADIVISKVREAKILQVISESYSVPQSNPDKETTRKRLEAFGDKGVFKKWNHSDLLKNVRVFTSRYVYKIKRSAKTGAAYRFKSTSNCTRFQDGESEGLCTKFLSDSRHSNCSHYYLNNSSK